MKNKNADIRQEVVNGTCYVYLIDKLGKCCFYREKTEKSIAVAHAIYLCEKYGERYVINELEKSIVA